MDTDRKAEIQKVARGSGSARGRGVTGSYAWKISHLERFVDDDRRLVEHLRGKVLLGLGAGHIAKAMAEYAAKVGVANYVAKDI